MIPTTPSKNFTGTILFATGILLGTLLFGGLVWANLEAVFYGLTRYTNETFNGLSCPVLMTRSETASLHVKVKNDTDKPISPLVRVEISTPGLAFSDQIQVSVEPGESKTLDWPLSEKNVDLNFFIFAKAYRYPAYQTPLAEDTCGVLVADIPLLNGPTLLALWLGASLVCTLAGLWMLERRREFPGQKASILTARRALAIAMLIGIILGIQGAWLPGVMALVAVVLLTSIILLFSIVH